MEFELEKSINQHAKRKVAIGFVVITLVGAIFTGSVLFLTSTGVITTAQQPTIVIFGLVPFLLVSIGVLSYYGSKAFGPKFNATFRLSGGELIVVQQQLNKVWLQAPLSQLSATPFNVIGAGTSISGGAHIGAGLVVAGPHGSTSIAALDSSVTWPSISRVDQIGSGGRLTTDWVCTADQMRAIAKLFELELGDSGYRPS